MIHIWPSVPLVNPTDLSSVKTCVTCETRTSNKTIKTLPAFFLRCPCSNDHRPLASEDAVGAYVASRSASWHRGWSVCLKLAWPSIVVGRQVVWAAADPDKNDLIRSRLTKPDLPIWPRLDSGRTCGGSSKSRFFPPAAHFFSIIRLGLTLIGFCNLPEICRNSRISEVVTTFGRMRF